MRPNLSLKRTARRRHVVAPISSHWLRYMVCAVIGLMSSQYAFSQLNTPGCIPVEQRGGREVGCYILITEKLGGLPQNQVFWVLYNYPDRTSAEAAKGPNDTVFESLGKIWLSHIG